MKYIEHHQSLIKQRQKDIQKATQEQNYSLLKKLSQSRISVEKKRIQFVKYSNNPVNGLKFQITKAFDNIIDFNESIIIDEEVFSLIENSFSSVLNPSSEQYKYYH